MVLNAERTASSHRCLFSPGALCRMWAMASSVPLFGWYARGVNGSRVGKHVADEGFKQLFESLAGYGGEDHGAPVIKLVTFCSLRMGMMVMNLGGDSQGQGEQ